MNNYEIITVDTVVVGSGAAGYNAACRIKQFGKKEVVIVSEGKNTGTSRNTGSDKQTYYKLGLGGNVSDSVRKMAEDLFAGGCVDGDVATVEAALSSRSFLNLCELGVPFPTNRYGEYIGYKTDHDPYARATAVGPLTSKFMTEALEKQSDALGIKLYNGLQVIEILKDNNSVCGLIALDKNTGNPVIFHCCNIVYATGGPAGIYADSVYPICHNGSTGVAFMAGAKGQNLTEWQYGLASIKPRWNVSGTYMQVLPRFVSVDDSGNEYEFLADYFDDIYEALSMEFLKGYQWPFDSRKVLNGSSVIDLLVYREKVIKKRRVFLDFRKNPFNIKDIEFEKLNSEAFDYLKKADACFGSPIERLKFMNTPAIELYKNKGVDIETEMLEISVCAQHNNGGLAVNMWWQTNIEGFFAAGEVAGTHGIYRPGGSALNAGQVGSLRAAQYISESGRCISGENTFTDIFLPKIKKHTEFFEKALSNENNVDIKIYEAQKRMSDIGGAIRSSEKIEAALKKIKFEIDNFNDTVGVANIKQLYKAYRLLDILICQYVYLTAMLDYSRKIVNTRGSALYYNKNGSLRDGLDEIFRFSEDNGLHNNIIQEISYNENGCIIEYRNVRPIASQDDFFENVWRTYRQNKNIY